MLRTTLEFGQSITRDRTRELRGSQRVQYAFFCDLLTIWNPAEFGGVGLLAYKGERSSPWPKFVWLDKLKLVASGNKTQGRR